MSHSVASVRHGVRDAFVKTFLHSPIFSRNKYSATQTLAGSRPEFGFWRLAELTEFEMPVLKVQIQTAPLDTEISWISFDCLDFEHIQSMAQKAVKLEIASMFSNFINISESGGVFKG